MKFTVNVTCSGCGAKFPAHGEATERFPAATCPTCGNQINVMDPLSISIVAERLLHRSQAEAEGGDPTISIICSAMAIESALTQVFIKWKSIERLGTDGDIGNEDQRESWEGEYRHGSKPGGFVASSSFIAKYLVGKSFDAFVKDLLVKGTAAQISSGIAQDPDELKADYIQRELFARRNRIMHWGEVRHTKEDAVKAWNAALTAFAGLKRMDRHRYEMMEETFRKAAAQP